MILSKQEKNLGQDREQDKEQEKLPLDNGNDFSTAESDKFYMDIAINQAEQAAKQGEVPVGAVIVYEDPSSQEKQIIAQAYNLRETKHDPCAHAEVIAMQRAAQALGYWRLHECILYVTLEPCIMCAGAIINARVKHIVYGCDDPKAGAVRSIYNILSDERLNHRTSFIAGLEAKRCAKLLKDFFRARRLENKQKSKRQKQNTYQVLKKNSLISIPNDEL